MYVCTLVASLRNEDRTRGTSVASFCNEDRRSIGDEEDTFILFIY
jgi:hypothetical protein